MAKSKADVKKRLQKYKEENKKLKQSKNWYPVTDEKKRFKRKTKVPKQTKLRESITPGTVLILLSGRFRGRRVIFLKQLQSGLLLVTGPYKLNGVPLKRVNQAYVIATKTKVNLGKLGSVEKIDDKFFEAKTPIKKTELNEIIIPSAEEKKSRVTSERKSAQSSVDTEIKKAIDGVALLKDYLRNRFGLKNGQQAHNLVF